MQDWSDDGDLSDDDDEYRYEKGSAEAWPIGHAYAVIALILVLMYLIFNLKLNLFVTQL